MSNRAFIETLLITKTYDKDNSYLTINVFDDYDDTYFEVDSIPDNDIDIFKLVMEEMEESYNEKIEHILDNMKESGKGIIINNNYLESHEIDIIIKEFKDKNDE